VPSSLGGTITSHDVKKVSTCLSFSHFTFSALFFKPQLLNANLWRFNQLCLRLNRLELIRPQNAHHFIFAHHSVVQSEMIGEFLSSNSSSSSPKIALIDYVLSAAGKVGSSSFVAGGCQQLLTHLHFKRNGANQSQHQSLARLVHL
jgi:hypothetical protein